MAMTPPFATVDDLAAGWRPLTADEMLRATTLLERASQVILDEDRRGVLDGLTAPTSTHVRIVCDMVKRVLSVGADVQGVTQTGQTVGPFSLQATYSNPSGDLYLTKAERRQLGFGRMSAGSSAMWGESTFVAEF